MDISLIIYSALGAGVGGALGALLSQAFQGSKTDEDGKSNRRTILGSILAVVGLFSAQALYKNMVLPRLVPMEMADSGLNMPMYQAMKKYEPDAYKELMEPLDRLNRSGDYSPEALVETRTKLEEIIQTKRKNASGAQLRQETELARDMYELLNDKAPIVCVQKMYGRPFAALTGVLPEEFTQKEQQVMASYFSLPSRPDNIVEDAERGTELFQNIVAESVSDLAVTDLDPSETDEAGQKKICALLVLVHEKMLNFDEQTTIDIYASLNQ